MPWNEGEGGEYAEKIPTCRGAELRIARINIATPVKISKNGDRMIQLVFEDLESREAAMMLMIEGKGQWKLKTLFHSLGHHVHRLTLDPAHLVIQEIANHWLLNKTVRADVTLLPPNADGKQYHEIKFLDARPAETPAEDDAKRAAVAGPKPGDDGCPF